MGGFSRPAQRRVGVSGGAKGVSTWADGERRGWLSEGERQLPTGTGEQQ